MSNLDHADFISNVQDDDSHPADVYSPQEEEAMYAAWLDRQRATADAAIANAAELTKLAPLTATTREVPTEIWSDLRDAFSKPVRPTIAARVADHVASL